MNTDHVIYITTKNARHGATSKRTTAGPKPVQPVESTDSARSNYCMACRHSQPTSQASTSGWNGGRCGGSNDFGIFAIQRESVEM